MADELKNFYQALGDEALDLSKPEDRRIYVPDLHRHGNPVDLIEKLADRITWDEGGGAYLFTGQRGTGKTTELRRLAHTLSDRSCSVIYVDISEHLDLKSPVKLSDFLITLFGAVADQVKARYKLDLVADSFWQRLGDFLQTQVKFERMAVGAALPSGVKLELQGALRSDPDFKSQLQEKIRGHIARLVEDSRRFAREVAAAVCKADTTARFVLIVDSLEQARGFGANYSEVFSSLEELFQQSDKLHFEDVHVVYSIPPYLMAMAGALGAYCTGGMIYALSGVHLFKDCTREVSAEGLGKMVEIVNHRFPGWEAVIDRGQLEAVALASGGDIRDYLRTLRLCLAELNGLRRAGKPKDKISAELVASAKNQLLRDMLPIAESDRAWLQRIAATKQVSLPTLGDLPTLARFFESKLVLNYRNGQDWYDIHPLLREHIGSDSAAAASA
jgi:hypothetical protein